MRRTKGTTTSNSGVSRREGHDASGYSARFRPPELIDDAAVLDPKLRGEVVWQKGEGANGSCAWGSFRSPTNPVLRDITERVVIASKGRFDRALTDVIDLVDPPSRERLARYALGHATAPQPGFWTTDDLSRD